MNISFYNQKSDFNVVSKSIGSTILSVDDAQANASFSLRGGSVRISTDTDLSKVNYAYISDLNRYYYVGDIVAVRKGIYDIPLRCDVLMTFASGIRNLTGTVDRQENLYNGYIPDNQYKQVAYSQITTKLFPNSMNADSLILMTVG